MIVLLSPAKTIDCTAMDHASSASQPAFLEEAEYLVHILANFSSKKLQSLMKISPELAELNVERYRNWHAPFHPGNASPCIECFQGEVYRGLDAKTFKQPDRACAQPHLRILTGLEGV